MRIIATIWGIYCLHAYEYKVDQVSQPFYMYLTPNYHNFSTVIIIEIMLTYTSKINIQSVGHSYLANDGIYH